MADKDALELLREAHTHMEAFTDPEGNMPENTGEFRDLKATMLCIDAFLRAEDAKKAEGQATPEATDKPAGKMADKDALELLREALRVALGESHSMTMTQVRAILHAEDAKKAEGQGGNGTLAADAAVAPAPSAPVSSEKVQPLSLGDVLHYELEGVIQDIDDEVCKDTLRRVQAALNEHFAVSATQRSVVEQIIRDLDAEGRASVTIAWGKQDGEPTIRLWLENWLRRVASGNERDGIVYSHKNSEGV